MAITLDYIHHLCLEGESARLDYKREQYKGISINCRIFPESTLKEALARDILL